MAKLQIKRSAVQAFAVDLGELRTKRLEILGEIATLSRRTIPTADVETRVDGLLSHHESAARVWLSLAGASSADDFGSFGIDSAFKHEPLGALAIFGDRTAVRARIIAEVEAARVAEPMSDAEYEARMASLRAQVSDVEHAEESLIREAEASGFNLGRREDADPALFLLSDEAFE